jgi:hypothetical protein
MWPFSKPANKTAPEYPISKTLMRAADVLGMKVDPMTSGFLSQARIIEEIAKRLVAIEKKTD